MKVMAERLQGFYRYRFLLKQLVVKDIKLKYRRSFLGYLWSILNPLLLMTVLYIVFSHMFRFEIENYPAYLIIGQTLFNFVNEATSQAINSIVWNAPLMKKVYVPKYIFTVSKVTSSLVNLLFAMGAMLIVFIVTQIKFSFYMLFIPVIVLQLYLFALGFGLFLAQAAVFFRDIQYIYNVIMTAWMYLTPIFYPVSILPETIRKAVVVLNPMYFYVQQFRAVVLDCAMPDLYLVGGGFVSAFIVLFIGIWSFLRTQDRFILYV